VTPEQARGARAMLKVGVREVSNAVGVTPNTVSRIEARSDPSKRGPQTSTITVLQSWYESQGIQFIENGDTALGNGVVLKEDMTPETP